MQLPVPAKPKGAGQQHELCLNLHAVQLVFSCESIEGFYATASTCMRSSLCA